MTATAASLGPSPGHRRSPPLWKVLIVEDSPVVAELHRRLVDQVPDFRSIAIRRDGEAAYQAVVSLRPDLAIVDLAMPGGGGLPFLRRIRNDGLPVEAIVVTASRESQAVREALQLGAIDYLVKPFAPERLQAALAAFAQRIRTLQRTQLGQNEVDLANTSGAMRVPRLPKGLRRSTLVAVQSTLEGAEGALGASEVGERVGVARVTARRYLEYLEVIGLARLERDNHGPGRPRNRYRKGPGRSS
ncbi:MAG TPA: response regulator [Gaiellaceae bacterium]